MNFKDLSRAIHQATGSYNDAEFGVQFRGISLKLQAELKEIGGIEEASDVVKLPEYLTVFVVKITSGEDACTPSLEEWREADIEFQSAVFKAIQDKMNPGKSTALPSNDSYEAAAGKA